MISQEHKNISQWVMNKALSLGAQQCKVNFSMGHEKLVEIRDGELDQINHAASCMLTIHLYVDGRYSIVTTNRIEIEELNSFIKKSIENTRLLTEDPHRYLADKALYYSNLNEIDLQNYDYEYSAISMEDKLKVAHSAYEEMLTYKNKIISATAMVDDYEESSYIINSNGFVGSTKNSNFALSCTTSVAGNGEERPEGYWYDFDIFWKNLPKNGIGKESAMRAIRKIGSRKIKDGNYNMIVENVVANRLLSPIINALKGEAIQQHQSFLIDKKGENIFSPLFTISDNPLEIGNGASQLFDAEGIALKDMKIIHKGKIENYYISQYISRKLNCKATTTSPTIIKFPKGKSSLQELIASQDKAIFVTAFNGGNCNGTTGDFSYGIEGFLIEKGLITTPFSEMIITGNMIELWNSLCAIANDARVKSSWQMPSLLFENTIIS